ncbi:MAG: substrate-binding domain-containing protein, partial [Lachnospiraceae bacterium]|nr:substrate-binding domain-containing protein [Lachnospiraceae bacterium]
KDEPVETPPRIARRQDGSSMEVRYAKDEPVETPPRSARRQDGSSMEVRCAKDEPVECERQQLREYMDRLGIPVITMDESGFSCGGIDVVFDYNEAAYLATRHLLELGHRRIGCVAGTQDFKVTQDRLDGYSKALAEEGIPFDEELIYKGNYTLKSGKQSLSYLLGKRVSAIFSMNDEMAFGIYQSARMYGVRIPDDLSVIGCDNVPFGDSLEVPLSTLNVPAEEMGQLIGKKMIEAVERFEGKDKKRMIINYRPTLLVKGSTARYGREAE